MLLASLRLEAACFESLNEIFECSFQTVSLVGKTSLIKALSSSEKLNPEGHLFATLDVTATSAILPNKLR